jgi:hypothetical protein
MANTFIEEAFAGDTATARRVYQNLDVPTVLRLRNSTAQGVHPLFELRMGRLSSAVAALADEARRVVNQNEIEPEQGTRIIAQLEAGHQAGRRLLELSKSDFVLQSVREAAESMGRSAGLVSFMAARYPVMKAELDKWQTTMTFMAERTPQIAQEFENAYQMLRTGLGSAGEAHEDLQFESGPSM